MDLNRATIIGRLTRDPELRSLTSGRSVASFSVATNRQWTDANGQRQKLVEYHNIVAWAKMAETANQYLHKGSRVYVEGRLQTREWAAQDGSKRNRTEIVADTFIMLDAKPTGSNENTFSPTTSATASSAPEEVVEEEIKVEDIPF
ncbi:MAG TPA: single-stranded DNA-binding protein [Patescibacteria group bacterium]|nr:single-stranded DNA-binding protein [Patescibacteria group bacterium]